MTLVTERSGVCDQAHEQEANPDDLRKYHAHLPGTPLDCAECCGDQLASRHKRMEVKFAVLRRAPGRCSGFNPRARGPAMPVVRQRREPVSCRNLDRRRDLDANRRVDVHGSVHGAN